MKVKFFSILFLAVFTFVSPALAVDASAAKVVKVEADKVCMVNDKLFPNKQIPVEVDSKTYYGCCEMCKKTLANDAKSRMAIDPISKKEVDKATAVIGSTEAGDIFYFESEENLNKYNQ